MRFTKKFTKIIDLNQELDGKVIVIRSRVQNTRAAGKGTFLVLREQFSTVQAVLFEGEGISKGMVKWAGKISKESIVEVKAKVGKVDKPTACT